MCTAAGIQAAQYTTESLRVFQATFIAERCQPAYTAVVRRPEHIHFCKGVTTASIYRYEAQVQMRMMRCLCESEASLCDDVMCMMYEQALKDP